MDVSVVVPAMSGIMWSIAYLAIVYRGFKDKSFGMPLIPLALNIAWEFLIAVVYGHHSSGIVAVTQIAWLVLDVLIVVTFVRYGYRHYKEAFGISRPVFWFTTAVAFAGSAVVMALGIQFFAGFDTWFNNDVLDSARFIAFIQNLVISIGFVVMLWLRRSSEGQSFWIAVTKMIGTPLTVGWYYVFVSHQGDDIGFMAAVVGLTLLFDLWYCVLIYRQLRSEGRNPFARL